MREFEFSGDDRVLTGDDAWRRLFARIAPIIRKDIIVWLGISKAQHSVKDAGTESNEAVADYVAGAGLVINLLPNVSYEFFADDSSAISNDVENVATDMRSVVLEIDHWTKIDRKLDGGQRTGPDAEIRTAA